MKNHAKSIRVTSFFLMLLMVASCFVAVPMTASAAELNEAETSRTYETWTASTDGSTPKVIGSQSDFTDADDHGSFSMSTYNTNLKSYASPTATLKTVRTWVVDTNAYAPSTTAVPMDEFSFKASHVGEKKLMQVANPDPDNDSENVWYYNGNTAYGTITVSDDENLLWDSYCFTFSVDLCFTSFPKDLSLTDTQTPDDYPLSLLKWKYNSTFFSIRVNDEGKLCHGVRTDKTVTDMQFVLDQWHTVSMTVYPALGKWEVALDDKVGYTGSFTAVTAKTSLSELVLFDAMYTYNAYVKNPTVTAKTCDDKVWGFENSAGIVALHDTENVLGSYDSFSVVTDMYFSAFPTGTYDGKDSMAYPFSLIKWRLKRSGTGLQHYSIRINGEGELCTGVNESDRTGVKVPLGEWFTVQMNFSPSGGQYDVWINGELKLIGTFTAAPTTTQSDICIFDNAFQYSAYIRDTKVIQQAEDIVGVDRVDSADYFGYQTKAITGDTFDIRFLSSVDPKAFSENGATTSDRFAEAGYEITAVWKKDGVVESSVKDVVTDSVYSSVAAKDGTFTMSNGDYIHAFAVRGVDATLDRIEFAVRPYTVYMDGSRFYGTATILGWDGDLDDNGCPLFSRVSLPAEYTNLASDDAHIRFSSNASDADAGPNGTKNILYVKCAGNTASTIPYNRQAYVKFSFTEEGIARIADAGSILLQLRVAAAPAEGTWTTAEQAAGGVMGRINGCATDWSESTLCGVNNYSGNMPTVDSNSWDIVYREGDVIRVDVTNYVKTKAASGAVAFMIENTVASSRGDSTSFYSSEAGDNGPTLLVDPSLFNYEVDLEKLGNAGYEPWSYAEKLVADWVGGGYENVYSSGDVSWHIDYNDMESVTDNKGSSAYSFTVGSSTRIALADSPTDPTRTVMTIGVNGNPAYYKITDTNKALLSQSSFSFSFNFYFDQLPTGVISSSDSSTANEKPLNFLRWMPTSGTYDAGIRIDADGQLCGGTTNTPSSQIGTGTYVEEDRWYNLRIDYTLATKSYTAYLDGKAFLDGSYTVTPNQSVFHMFDGNYKYTAYIKDIRIYGHDGFATYDLEPETLTSATGAYTTAINWRHNRLGAGKQSRVYVRSIDTLATVEGYNKSAVDAPTYDQYGGITDSGIEGQATGYFHIEIHNGRTFIIDPLGNPYFAVGMNTVELGATDNQDKLALAKYGDADTFYSSIATDLRKLGINTVWGGDWEDLMATQQVGTVIHLSLMTTYMNSIGLSLNNSYEKFKYNNAMNAFDPDFAAHCKTVIADEAGDYVNNPHILGYISDNEITSEKDMLIRYLTVDPSDPLNAFSYAAAWTFLKARTGKANPSTTDVTAALSEEFKAFVYDTYFTVVTEALDEVGAKQMYLGNRIHSDNKSSEGYLRAASRYVDILTVNLYGGPEPPIDDIECMYQYSGKPIIVTEFYAKAMDTTDANGVPLMNQSNAGWIVQSQEDRAAHYENYVMLLLESRCCVGWTWYRFRDNDQCIYMDASGNLYVDYGIESGAVTSYIKIGTGTVDANGVLATKSLDQALLNAIKNIDLSVAGDPLTGFVYSKSALGTLTKVYKGESGGDNSNNGSNKGLYDNNMNIYQPLADAYVKVDKHIMGLVNYFDNLHN